MTKIDENIQTAQNMLSGIVERCYELEEENKKLKEKLDNRDLLLEGKRKEVQTLLKVNEELTAKNKKLKEDVEFYYKSAKQFREDAESWRKECERLLGLQICGKTVAERIEYDKKVFRE